MTVAAFPVPTRLGAPSPASSSAAAHRCVVVGAGSAGRRHLRNLSSLGIEAFALRSNRGQAGALHGWSTVHDWSEVAALAPTLAIIADPTSQHVESALEAVRRRCHVLVEKPVADTLPSALRLETAVRDARRVGMVGYQFRFHPALVRAREWIRDGMIGQPMTAHAHWGEYLPGWHPGEDHRAGYSARRALGGGVVLTLSHPVDYLRWLLGEVEAVSAMTARRSGYTVDVEDIAALTLRLTNGAIATVTLDYVERPASHRLSITGRDGTITWDAQSGVAQLRRPRSGERDVATPPPSFERNTMFVDELRHFLDCVNGAADPICSIHDGVRAVAIAEGALRSAADGRVIDV